MRRSAGWRAALDLLVTAINRVDPDTFPGGRAGAGWLLYEDFLAVYDGARRRSSGSYYTPPEVADQLVRLVDEVVRQRAGFAEGLAAPGLTLVDPAMGAGTFLHAAGEVIAGRQPARAGAAGEEVGPRLVGIERQMAPYTLARLHATGLNGAGLNGAAGRAPAPTLVRADALRQPLVLPGLEGATASPASVIVVVGNPPIHARAKGPAAASPATVWPGPGIGRDDRARGRTGPGRVPPDHDDLGAGAGPMAGLLDAFRYPGNGRTEHVLHNLSVYFARWAAWTAFEAHPASHGIIALITTAGILRGSGHRGLRAYLRRTCDEGWIIDLSPEGLRPAAGTRLFPTVQQPLAIAIFWRHPTPNETNGATPRRPATIHYTALSGTRRQKLAQLRALTLHSPRWRPVRPDWTAPLTPAATTRWDDLPALTDLMPYSVPGIKPNRTWVYAPARACCAPAGAR